MFKKVLDSDYFINGYKKDINNYSLASNVNPNLYKNKKRLTLEKAIFHIQDLELLEDHLIGKLEIKNCFLYDPAQRKSKYIKNKRIGVSNPDCHGYNDEKITFRQDRLILPKGLEIFSIEDTNLKSVGGIIFPDSLISLSLYSDNGLCISKGDLILPPKLYHLGLNSNNIYTLENKVMLTDSLGVLALNNNMSIEEIISIIYLYPNLKTIWLFAGKSNYLNSTNIIPIIESAISIDRITEMINIDTIRDFIKRIGKVLRLHKNQFDINKIVNQFIIKRADEKEFEKDNHPLTKFNIQKSYDFCLKQHGSSVKTCINDIINQIKNIMNNLEETSPSKGKLVWRLEEIKNDNENGNKTPLYILDKIIELGNDILIEIDFK